MRIAGELHDVVAHELTLINAQAGVRVHLREHKPEVAADQLVPIRDRSKEALDELRSIVGLLGEPGEATQEPVPGLERLDDLADAFTRAGLGVEIITDGQAVPVPPVCGPDRLSDRAGAADQRAQARGCRLSAGPAELSA